MSNHYHLILHVDSERIEQLSESDIIKRWLRIYKGPQIIHDYLEDKLEDQIQKDMVSRLVNTWRTRLKDISWFMRCLNEYIARKANFEDSCTGRFWEGRFKSQALLDEAALLSCMAYVDLNPIRAGISPNLEKSDFTSIQQRILSAKNRKQKNYKLLMAFSTHRSENQEQKPIPFRLKDYLDLVEWTGRAIRNDKRGFITKTEPKLITNLGIDTEQWKYLTDTIQERTMTSLHGMESLQRLNKKRKAA